MTTRIRQQSPDCLGKREPERSRAGCGALRPNGAGYDAEEPPVPHPLQEQQGAKIRYHTDAWLQRRSVRRGKIRAGEAARGDH